MQGLRRDVMRGKDDKFLRRFTVCGRNELIEGEYHYNNWLLLVITSIGKRPKIREVREVLNLAVTVRESGNIRSRQNDEEAHR